MDLEIADMLTTDIGRHAFSTNRLRKQPVKERQAFTHMSAGAAQTTLGEYIALAKVKQSWADEVADPEQEIEEPLIARGTDVSVLLPVWFDGNQRGQDSPTGLAMKSANVAQKAMIIGVFPFGTSTA
jgi:hypothetical protein